jgi:hypothetical protein
MSAFRNARSTQAAGDHQAGYATRSGAWTEAGAGGDTWSRATADSRAFTETGAGSDSWSRTEIEPRTWTEVGAGADGWAFGNLAFITEAGAGTDTWSTSYPMSVRTWVEDVRGQDLWNVHAPGVTIISTPRWSRPFRNARSRQGGGDTQAGPSTTAWTEAGGGYDSWSLLQKVTSLFTELGRGFDSWFATKGPAVAFNETGAGLDTWTSTTARTRAWTEIGSGTDTWARVARSTRAWVELGRGIDDQWFWQSGPRSVFRDARLLSQIWGKGPASDAYGAAIDLHPLRSNGSDAPLTNDTIGADLGAGPSSMGNLVAGSDIGGLIDFLDGEIGIVGGDTFGPDNPAGYSHSHPSIGKGSTWTYYRPSVLAISKTQLADLPNGLAIDRFHRRMALRNPAGGLTLVSGAAPLQSDVTYSGTAPNRVATFPKHFYAFQSGVAVPDVGGDLFLYSCDHEQDGLSGLFTSVNKTDWSHRSLWVNSTTYYWKGGSLEIADASGNPPPSVAAVRADIAAGTGTYYLYSLGSNAGHPSDPGLYLARCKLQPLAGTALNRLVATTPGGFGGFAPTYWEYWDGTAWGQQGASAPVPARLMADTKFNSLTGGGYSIRFHKHIEGGRWVLAYCGPFKNSAGIEIRGGTRITYRTAPTITGPWSGERYIDGMDWANTPGVNVTSHLYPYSAQIHPYCLDSDKLILVVSTGYPLNQPDPSIHAFVDDGTGHCQRWRGHITTTIVPSTSGNIGCGLTLAQHNAMQAAYASNSETPGYGFSVPYATFLVEATLGRSVPSSESFTESGGGTDTWSTPPRTFSRVWTETATASDGWQSFLGRNIRIDLEPGNGTDSWSIQTGPTAAFTEIGAGTDGWVSVHPAAPWNELSTTVDTWSSAVGGFFRFWIEERTADDDWGIRVRTLAPPATWAASPPTVRWTATVVTTSRWEIGVSAGRWTISGADESRWSARQVARWRAGLRDAVTG